MSKLCILGEDAEPCFEGSQITNVQFSFDDGFMQQLSTMFAELKEFLNEGGTKLNRYAVEIGEGLWESLHRYLLANYADPEDSWCSIYCVEGIYEESDQKFAILKNRQDNKYYRLNFSLTEQDGFVPATEFTEMEKTFVPAESPQFDPEAVKAYELEFKKQEEEKKKKNEEKPADDGEDEEKPADDGEEKPSDDEDEKKKKKTYSLEEYESLQATLNSLQEKNQELEDQLNSLIEFKAQVEREKKEEMINSFYMLSDEDKKDVIENIDKYSLDDIEAKLSIICVRNKVNFNLDEPEDNKDPEDGPVVFDLDNDDADDTTPAWVKAALDVAKNME